LATPLAFNFPPAYHRRIIWLGFPANPGTIFVKFFVDVNGNARWRRNIVENFNRLSTVQCARTLGLYRALDDKQTDNSRQTDGRQHIAKVNVSSRSLKSLKMYFSYFTIRYYAVDYDTIRH